MQRNRRLLWPAVMFCLMLALTLGLGIWQLQRLAWKEAVLVEIAHAESGAPVPLSRYSASYSKVAVRGSLLPGFIRYGAELHFVGQTQVMGARIIRPVSVLGVGTILTDFGWAPLDFVPSNPASVDITGYTRPPETGAWYSPAADVAARRFFSMEPAEVAEVLGLRAVLPFTVVVMGAPGQMPMTATTMPRPPNNHLMYAYTWFALAAGLSGVFSAYVWQNRRRKKPGPAEL